MSWEQLAAIREEARQLAAEDAEAPPVACFRCGEPLSSAPDGGLFCRFDGWRPGTD